jgi:hypothetical protein
LKIGPLGAVLYEPQCAGGHVQVSPENRELKMGPPARFSENRDVLLLTLGGSAGNRE